MPIKNPIAKPKSELLTPRIGSVKISKNKQFKPSPSKTVGTYKELLMLIFPYSFNKAITKTTSRIKNKIYSKK